MIISQLILILPAHNSDFKSHLKLLTEKPYHTLWDNTPLFVKYNPGLLKLAGLLDETGCQTGL
jgi:hypothetical protein